MILDDGLHSREFFEIVYGTVSLMTVEGAHRFLQLSMQRNRQTCARGKDFYRNRAQASAALQLNLRVHGEQL